MKAGTLDSSWIHGLCLSSGDHGAPLEGGVQRAGWMSRQHQRCHLHQKTLREVAAEARVSFRNRRGLEPSTCLCLRLMLPYEEHLRAGGAHFKVPECLEPPKPQAMRGRRPLPRGRRPGPKAKERKTSAPPHPPAVSSQHGAPCCSSSDGSADPACSCWWTEDGLFFSRS